MIAMQYGVQPDVLINTLRDSAREAGNALGVTHPEEVLDRYRQWTHAVVRVLRPLVTAAELDRLVMTRRYWAVDSGVDYSSPTSYANPIREELSAQKELLEREAAELASWTKRWGNSNSTALVPDTSVFVEMGGGFADLDWHDRIGERSDVFIFIVVTMAVVRELDGKKLSRAQDSHGVSVRTKVRSALRRIEELFPNPETMAPCNHQREGDVMSFANIALLPDSLGHRPLGETDAEVIERGLSLLPFVTRASLVTYDLNQAFRARTSGLGAVRLKYDDETEG